jgi:hypothetical protein
MVEKLLSIGADIDHMD